MRNLRDPEIDRYRITHPARLQWFGGWGGDETCGAFEVRSERSGHMLRVLASSDGAWDHVSVSLEKRAPTWYEMEQIKRLFFKDHETAMQLHVPPAQHINCHPNCLHLWRPQNSAIPLPPSWMVVLPPSCTCGVMSSSVT